MDSRQILQRICAIATGVPTNRVKTKNLSLWSGIKLQNGGLIDLTMVEKL